MHYILSSPLRESIMFYFSFHVLVLRILFYSLLWFIVFFFFQAEDGIRDHCVTGVQTCALPICTRACAARRSRRRRRAPPTPRSCSDMRARPRSSTRRSRTSPSSPPIRSPRTGSSSRRRSRAASLRSEDVV